MLRPLRDHFMNLEHRLQALRDELTRPNLTAEERKRIEMRMQLSELALKHYVKAFELERRSE
jgi:hypothetical protein